MTNTQQQIANLHNLLDHDACKFSCAEAELKNVLPQWIREAESLQLKILLEKYQDFVEDNIKQIDGFCIEENIRLISLSNRIMKAFIEEAEEKMSLCIDTAVKDASLIACVQAVNHFKISMYGTAAAFAMELGMDKYAAAFHECEVKEKQIDERLSQLATFEINQYARVAILLDQRKN